MPLPPGSSDSGQALLSSKCAAWRSPMLSSSATPSGTSSRLDLNDSLQYVRCCQPRLLHPVVSPGSEMLPFLVVPHFFELMPHRRPAQLSRHLRSIIICAEDIDVRHWISAFLSLKQFWMGWQSILHLWQSHLLPWRKLYVSLPWYCRLDSQLRFFWSVHVIFWGVLFRYVCGVAQLCTLGLRDSFTSKGFVSMSCTASRWNSSLQRFTPSSPSCFSLPCNSPTPWLVFKDCQLHFVRWRCISIWCHWAQL